MSRSKATFRCFRKPVGDRAFFTLLAFLIAFTGCGGRENASSPPPPPSQINSVSISPNSISLVTGDSQLFTAQVQGTGEFSSDVSWSVNGVAGGNSTYGTITGSGQFTAPAVTPNPASVTITATSIQDTTKSGNSTAIILVPVVLNSITPTAASAGEVLTVSATFNLDVIEKPQAVFSGANGTSISMPLEVGNSPPTVAVPFGAISGPVYLTIPPQPGGAITIVETSNSVEFSRLPNLQVRAANKDLSSGETLQLDWRILGASTPNAVTWTADSGTISAQGVFQAPSVPSESYSHVTGCITNTNSCNTALLRILPFRITPSNPIVNVGGTLQLDAIQGSSTLSPQWSILAGDGSISSGGLFTAPTTVTGAGPVTISATVGSTTEQTSIAVSGAYAGQVNRVYDYADFTKYTPPESTYVQSVAVNGNRAYALTIGDPYLGTPLYEALDVYDITNPELPVWIDAGESATNYAATLFTYGNVLVSLDSNYLVAYSLTSQVPTVTQIIPITQPFQWTQNGAVLYVLPYLNLDLILPSMPIDLYDASSGTVVHKHYELPFPQNGSLGELYGITGTGNIVYVSGLDDINGTRTFTIATYDLSQSPPALLSTVVNTTDFEFNLHLSGNLLFAGSVVYDVSNVTPMPLTTLPLPLEAVWGTQSNDVLATIGTPTQGPPGYAVIDISSQSNPVVHANVSDLQSWDIFNPGTATWASNGTFYTADGTGGFAVYDVSPSGGPTSMSTASIFQYIYDQAIEQQTIYAAAVYGSGAGGVACFDVSQGQPNLLGTLTYANDSAFALQVSGTNVFLGLADSLKVVDVSNPQSPAEIASIAIPVNALVLSDSKLFVGTGDGRLVVFDVSTPNSPTQISSVTMAVPSTLRLSGTLLLVAAGQSGLFVFDVSNASAPKMLSQFSPSISAPVWDVIPVGGSAVMLAADSSGIVTVDISNPSQPHQLYQEPLPYVTAFPDHYSETGIVPAFSLASQNGLTYVGTTDGILLAYDATVPVLPRLVALDVVGYALDVLPAITPAGNTLFIADQGVLIQMDNTVPQNVIEIYDPPAALSLASPITDAARRKGINGNRKKEWRLLAPKAQKLGAVRTLQSPLEMLP